MTTKKKSQAVKQLEKIRKSPLKFQDLLHSVRVTEEMTQQELAEMIGTSRAKICDFEKGRRKPSLQLAAEMADALGHSRVLFVSKLIEDQLEEADLKLKVKIEAA